MLLNLDFWRKVLIVSFWQFLALSVPWSIISIFTRSLGGPAIVDDEFFFSYYDKERADKDNFISFITGQDSLWTFILIIFAIVVIFILVYTLLRFEEKIYKVYFSFKDGKESKNKN